MRVSDAPRLGHQNWNNFRARVLTVLESIVSDHACNYLRAYSDRSWAWELAERYPLLVESDSDLFYLTLLVHELRELAKANFLSTINARGQFRLL